MQKISLEDLEKWINFVGKDIYVLENTIAPGHPFVKAVKISSLEIYPNGSAQLKTNNDGSYWPQFENAHFYTTREDAVKALNEQYGPVAIDISSIKKCPKCDGLGDIKTYPGGYYFIECHDCGLRTRNHWKLRDAITDWNDRKDN